MFPLLLLFRDPLALTTMRAALRIFQMEQEVYVIQKCKPDPRFPSPQIHKEKIFYRAHIINDDGKGTHRMFPVGNRARKAQVSVSAAPLCFWLCGLRPGTYPF